MADHIIEVARGFWNIRGSFRVAGLFDVGTHASLVRRADGSFVLLDAYTFTGEVAGAIDELTDGGAAVAVILNLHPFHTVHVERTHARFPEARLYGTARHRERFPDLPWEDAGTEDPATHDEFSDDFAFSVPRGVELISANEQVHFSSVLALHRASGTLHVDDTLNYVAPDSALRWLGMGDTVSFHPTLAKALEPRAGAAQEFRDWATGLIRKWRKARNLCAAHTAALLDRDNRGAPLHERLNQALEKAGPTLDRHERRYG